MKRSFKCLVAGVLATVLALIPLTAFANTDYNPDVTKADGTLKTGYYPADKNDKDEDGNPAIWWKTVPDTEGWKETDKATYDLTDDDQRKTADGGFTSWRVVDFATYASVTDTDLKQSSFTDWRDATRDEYYAVSDDNLKNMIAGPWTSADKATYDSLPDDQRKATVGDWWTLGDSSNWKDKMDIWNSYPAENRRATGIPITFHEVDKDTYLAFEQLWPGQYGKDKMYYYEDNSQPELFSNWPCPWTDYSYERYDGYQIVANTYNAYCHDPGFVYVGTINIMPGYGGAEARSWNGVKDDGVIYLGNLTSQIVAEGWMKIIKDNGVPYTTVSSSSDIPKNVAPDKLNAANAAAELKGDPSGNDIIVDADTDFKIYYFEGTEISLDGFYGILIAPNAKVSVNGKWIGTIIADTVDSYGESTCWKYGINKGIVDTHYYIADPLLEVRDITYEKRTVTYQIRDNKFEIRDRVVKYYVTGTKDFYCLKYKYIPKTGDLKTYLIIGGIIVLLGAAVALIVTNRVKSRRQRSLR